MSEPGITLEIASARLQLYLSAEAAVLSSQAYKIGDRELTRADLGEIRQGISYWSGQVERSNPRPRVAGRVRSGSYRVR